MLATPFEPLSDAEFLELTASGLAIPCQQGATFFVAKWRDGPGLDPEKFLASLQAQGSTLMARRFNGDVNIRVVRSPQPAAGGRQSSSSSRTASA